MTYLNTKKFKPILSKLLLFISAVLIICSWSVYYVVYVISSRVVIAHISSDSEFGVFMYDMLKDYSSGCFIALLCVSILPTMLSYICDIRSLREKQSIIILSILAITIISINLHVFSIGYQEAISNTKMIIRKPNSSFKIPFYIFKEMIKKTINRNKASSAALPFSSNLAVQRDSKSYGILKISTSINYLSSIMASGSYSCPDRSVRGND